MRQMETRRMCPHCRAFITTHDRVCPYCNEKVGPKAIDRRNPGEILGGLIPQAQFTTIVILVINFGLFIATVLYSMKGGNGSAFLGIDPQTLFNFGAKYPPYIRAGQWWRLVTAGFLHGGVLHILMNSWVLFDVGAQVEEIYGTSRLLVIYFASTVAGFYLSTLWSRAISVGASAALMGLIGAMIALSMHHRSAMTTAIRGTYIRWVVYILLIGLLPGIGIDNAAHIGGLAAGFGVAYAAGLPSAVPSAREQVWRVAAWVCVAVTAFSFFEMFLWLTRGSGAQF
ncbi:MAG: rhomboid family intramembrane serine protease [Acidobacteriia bacterium]|nr:rhomboid family intramembrane serine protease [Terriglobia bacterium]